MWQVIWSWIKTNPQKSTGLVAQATGYVVLAAPTLINSPRVLAGVVAFFGLVQTIFGFLAKPDPQP